jgi:hypothetical protein
MMLVGAAAGFLWRRGLRQSFRPLWIGALLWAVAVALKFACALAINKSVIAFLADWHSRPLLLVAGSCFLGIESAFFEIGLTHLAVLRWRQLGRDAPAAVGIGVGAGAIEALLVGAAMAAAALFAYAESTEGIAAATQMEALTKTTACYWLVGAVERSIALLGHTASRALVLLGTAHRRVAMVLSGWVLFVMVDGVAGAFILSGRSGHISLWWLELAVAPFAIAGIPIVRWCWTRWPRDQAGAPEIAYLA